MSWLRKIFGESKKSEVPNVANEFNRSMDEARSAGTIVGAEYYSASVEQIKELKRQARNQEAITLLLRCVDATEAECRKVQVVMNDDQFAWLAPDHADRVWGVAPWYYEQLAILYRREKQYSREVEILERYEKQEKSPGDLPIKLAERLVKARALMEKHHPAP